MSASPSISVLTCVHNGERFLRETLDSIAAQTYQDWEHIVVDDASDDTTPDIVCAAAETDARIRYHRRDVSGGPYVAANTGLDLVRGRWVMRIDADDVAVPERMARQVAFLEANRDLRACLGAWRWIGASGGPDDEVRRVHTTSPRVLRWSICVVSGLVHSSALVERSALDEVGRYRPYPTSADLGLWCDLSRRGWLGVMDDVVVLYRRHDEQITAIKPSSQREYAWEILRDHLVAMTDAAWTLEEVRALYATGRWERTTFDDGDAALGRWERAWRDDPFLLDADRRELRRLTMRVRLRHLRMNGRSVSAGIRGALGLLRRPATSAL